MNWKFTLCYAKQYCSNYMKRSSKHSELIVSAKMNPALKYFNQRLNTEFKFAL